MINKNLQKKGLIFVTIALFFGMCAVPSAGNSEVEKYASVEYNLSDFTKPLNSDPVIIPEVSGTMGEQNWYISDVDIALYYDNKLVESVYYRIREGEDWILYSGPFYVTEDEIYHIALYWIDHEGKLHYDVAVIPIKLDQTSPTVTLTKHKILLDKNKLRFEADASDATSGLERVEFYLDDELQETLMSPPYEWIYIKPDEEEHFVYAIVYDIAGNSENSETLSTPLTSFYNAMILSKFIQRIQSMVMWNQNALKLISYLFSSMIIHGN